MGSRGEASMRKAWPWQWTMAGVLVLLVFGAHATVRYWLPVVLRHFFGEVPDLAQAPPALMLLLAGYVVLSVIGGLLIGVGITDGQSARDQARWAEAAEARRRLWAMEQQIREEQLSEAERARRQQDREQEAAIRREARRRLGLPEEEADENRVL
jgi:hypothetical protein